MATTLRAAEIERLEPPHWWVGMERSTLQLLVYGEDVGRWTPHLESYAGVELTRVERVENPNYLFLYFAISAEAPAGSLTIDFADASGSAILQKNYELRDRAPGSAAREGFDGSDVMYLITPDRFANGDPGNDTVASLGDPLDRSDPFGRHGGDLAGILAHLDYIEGMGFTALWLNPVLENAMPEASYHGYATTDFYRVDPRFGSNAIYRELAREASARGIGLIMDMILNHVGSEHWFVRDPPTADWINYGGEFVGTNHRRTTLVDPHAAAADRERFADGWFVESMPDLNQRQPLLADYLIQNSIWWIEEASLTGIRMDTYPYPDREFMAKWSCAVLSEYPDLNIVGEEWSLQPAIVAAWQRGQNNPDGYASCLPSLMDFPLQHALVQALAVPEDSFTEGWPQLYETLALDFLYAHPEDLVIFPDNHDMDRFYTQVGGDFDLWKLGMVYFLTTRGVPQIYYGTEILMRNDGAMGDHGVIRTDMPGGWPGDAVNAFTGEGLTDVQRVARDFVRTLLRWRKNQAIIHEGKLMHFAPEKGVYVYFRYTDEGSVMVALNKNATPVSLPLDRFSERLEGYSAGRDVLSGATFAIEREGAMELPPFAALVLELE